MLGCCIIAAVLALTVALAWLGAAVVARHRVQAAADLGALAAAGALDEGTVAGCARAEQVAGRMRARLRTCSVEEWDVVLSVEAAVSWGPLGIVVAHAQARAGPVDETR